MVAFLLKAGVVDTCMQCDGSFYWLGNQTRYQSKPAEDNTYILMDDTFKIHCQSAPHLAVANSHVKIGKLILSRAPETVHCTDFSGRTALHEAVRQDNVEIVEVLIENGARVSQECSHFQNLSSSVNILSAKEKRNTRKTCAIVVRLLSCLRQDMAISM